MKINTKYPPKNGPRNRRKEDYKKVATAAIGPVYLGGDTIQQKILYSYLQPTDFIGNVDLLRQNGFLNTSTQQLLYLNTNLKKEKKGFRKTKDPCCCIRYFRNERT